MGKAGAAAWAEAEGAAWAVAVGWAPLQDRCRKPPQSAAVLDDDVARLKQEAEQLRQQLRETEQRIRHIEGGDPGRRSG